VTEPEQHCFLDGAAPETSRIHVCRREHTLYDNAAERNARTADWFADRLLPR